MCRARSNWCRDRCLKSSSLSIYKHKNRVWLIVKEFELVHGNELLPHTRHYEFKNKKIKKKGPYHQWEKVTLIELEALSISELSSKPQTTTTKVKTMWNSFLNIVKGTCILRVGWGWRWSGGHTWNWSFSHGRSFKNLEDSLSRSIGWSRRQRTKVAVIDVLSTMRRLLPSS